MKQKIYFTAEHQGDLNAKSFISDKTKICSFPLLWKQPYLYELSRAAWTLRFFSSRSSSSTWSLLRSFSCRSTRLFSCLMFSRCCFSTSSLPSNTCYDEKPTQSIHPAEQFFLCKSILKLLCLGKGKKSSESLLSLTESKKELQTGRRNTSHEEKTSGCFTPTTCKDQMENAIFKF